MNIKNETLRIFLATTAIILTAMLTEPITKDVSYAKDSGLTRTQVQRKAEQELISIQKPSQKHDRKLNRYVVVSERFSTR